MKWWQPTLAMAAAALIFGAWTRTGSTPAAPAPNSLTKEEKAAGWKLLFDGKSTKGWHGYGRKGVGSAWKIQDGALMLEVQQMQNGHWQAKDGGDIVTDKEYGDFELQLEWKIAACGNSGIMYRIVEDKKYKYPWQTGPEMQVLDNACHDDAKYPTHRAGSLYDIQTVSVENVKPAGEWNEVRIVLKGGHLEQWQNGVKVVETEMWTPEWNKRLTETKWKDHVDFAKAKKGRIGLQDHGNGVWFRNIKIRQM